MKHILKSNYLRKLSEPNLKMNQMLEVRDKDFKLALINPQLKKKVNVHLQRTKRENISREKKS